VEYKLDQHGDPPLLYGKLLIYKDIGLDT